MHYLLMGKLRLPFIDNDLLYIGARYGMAGLTAACFSHKVVFF